MLTIFFMFILSITLHAQEVAPFDLAKNVSGDTLIYFSLGKGSQSIAELQKLGLYQLFLDEEVQTLVKTFGNIREQMNVALEKIGISKEQFRGMLDGEISFAIPNITYENMPMPIPTVVITWDVGKEKEKVAQLLDMTVPQLPLDCQEGRVFDQRILTFKIPMAPCPVIVTFIGSSFVLTNNLAYLETVLAPDFALENSLAVDSHYKTVLNKLMANRAGLHMYCNVAKIVEIIKNNFVPDFYQEEVKNFLKIFGLDHLQSISLATTFANGEVVETLYLNFPDGKTGLFSKIFPDESKENKLLTYFPSKHIVFKHGHFYWNNIYTALKEIVSIYKPDVLEQLKEQEEKYNISLDKFFASLGTEYLQTMFCSGGLIPDYAIHFACEDIAGMKEFINSVFILLPEAHRRRTVWKGYDLFYYALGSSEKFIPIAPTIGFTEDCMIFTLYPETFKNVVEGPKGQIPEKVATMMASQNLKMANYCNMKAIVHIFYKTAVPLLQSILHRDEIPFDLVSLPSSETLQKYITDITSFMFNDKDGVLLEIHSPCGLILLSKSSSVLQQKIQQYIYGTMPRDYDEDDEEYEYYDNNEIYEGEENREENVEDDAVVENEANEENVVYEAREEDMGYEANENTMEYEANENAIEYEANENAMEYEANENAMEYEANENAMEYEANENAMEYEVNENAMEYEANENAMEYEANENEIENEVNENEIENEAREEDMEYEANENAMEYEANENEIENKAKEDVMEYEVKEDEVEYEASEDDIEYDDDDDEDNMGYDDDDDDDIEYDDDEDEDEEDDIEYENDEDEDEEDDIE